MSRKAKRELERAVRDLKPYPRRGTVDVCFRDEQTGEPVDEDGNPIERDPNVDHSVEITMALVLECLKAERRGYEILGPAKDVPEGRYVVRVVWDDAAQERAGEVR